MASAKSTAASTGARRWPSRDDDTYMTSALEGGTPNSKIGCVIVYETRVEGVKQEGNGPVDFGLRGQ